MGSRWTWPTSFLTTSGCICAFSSTTRRRSRRRKSRPGGGPSRTDGRAPRDATGTAAGFSIPVTLTRLDALDVSGQCTDQRSEIRSFAHRIKIKAYPVRESGGIVWAYLGPEESMTPFRDFGTDSLSPPQTGANKERIYCNWAQSMG